MCGARTCLVPIGCRARCVDADGGAFGVLVQATTAGLRGSRSLDCASPFLRAVVRRGNAAGHHHTPRFGDERAQLAPIDRIELHVHPVEAQV